MPRNNIRYTFINYDTISTQGCNTRVTWRVNNWKLNPRSLNHKSNVPTVKLVNSCTGCRSTSMSTSSSGQLRLEPSTRVHQLTLHVSCTDINHRGHCTPLQPCNGLMPLLTSNNILLLSLHCLPGTNNLLLSTILAPWSLSKLLWKHTSSTLPTHHATDSHSSAPPIHSFVTYGTNRGNIWLIDWLNKLNSNNQKWILPARPAVPEYCCVHTCSW